MSTATLDRGLVERLVRQALTQQLAANGHGRNGRAAPRLVVNISARHCHVTQEDLERLFGKGHRLTVHKPLYQDGFFAAQEAVTIIGPRRALSAFDSSTLAVKCTRGERSGQSPSAMTRAMSRSCSSGWRQ